MSSAQKLSIYHLSFLVPGSMALSYNTENSTRKKSYLEKLKERQNVTDYQNPSNFDATRNYLNEQARSVSYEYLHLLHGGEPEVGPLYLNSGDESDYIGHQGGGDFILREGEEDDDVYTEGNHDTSHEESEEEEKDSCESDSESCESRLLKNLAKQVITPGN